tara:strand:- start:675 stop:1055 length:381 start_codon:yes stop_codon:yes gene_type:complete
MVSAFYIGILALMYLGLTVYVIRARLSNRIGLGDGGNAMLNRRIRIHAHFAEFVPILVLMLVVLELQSVPAIWLHIMGFAIVLSRVFHAWGLVLSDMLTWQRQASMMMTFSLLFLGGAANIVLYLI